MNKSDDKSRTIRILGEDVARRIAAGEVIERPFSVVRELLDNAIDAGADEISVYLKEGGISSIRVVDNGLGMSADDLKLCYCAHATSKIQSLDDLDSLATLGFRGEALSSMAACARLEIISALTGSAEQAHRLVVQAGKIISFEPYRGTGGTVAEVSHLFFNMPARKKFLKRTSAETGMCKTVFIDKAVPFPDVVFKLFVDGEMKIFLNRETLKKRVTDAYHYNEHAELFFEASEQTGDFTLTVIGASPALYRKDRKHIELFVNKRRIFEYALVQAVEYGYREFLPGGLFPVCFVFLETDPGLVDFNIHPAKKEVRLKKLPFIHQTLVGLLKRILTQQAGTVSRRQTEHAKEQTTTYSGGFTFPVSRSEASRMEVIHDAGTSEPAEAEAYEFRYLGQLWKTFLIFDYRNTAYFLDQHAAHERLLFDTLQHEPAATGELLFPLGFEAEEEEAEVIIRNMEQLKNAGIVVQKISRTSFEILKLPQSMQALPENELIDCLKNGRANKDELLHELYAQTACRMAVKEGQEIDALTAVELFKGVLNLENPRCPHGRPLYYSLTKDELYKLTGRTV